MSICPVHLFSLTHACAMSVTLITSAILSQVLDLVIDLNYLTYPSQQSGELGIVIIPISCTRKLRLRKVTCSRSHKQDAVDAARSAHTSSLSPAV